MPQKGGIAAVYQIMADDTNPPSEPATESVDAMGDEQTDAADIADPDDGLSDVSAPWEDDTDEEAGVEDDPTAPPEEPAEINYIGTVEIFSKSSKSGSAPHITITDAVEFIGLTEDEVYDTSVYFDAEAVETSIPPDERLAPGMLATAEGSDDVPDGRRNKRWRSILVTSRRGDNPSYNVGLTDDILEVLGYDPDAATGELIDLWASESGMIVLTRPETATITVDNEVSLIDLLPPATAADYRAVVIEGRDPEEWVEAGEREFDIDADNEWTAVDAVERNVESAKQVIKEVTEAA